MPHPMIRYWFRRTVIVQLPRDTDNSSPTVDVSMAPPLSACSSDSDREPNEFVTLSTSKHLSKTTQNAPPQGDPARIITAPSGRCQRAMTVGFGPTKRSAGRGGAARRPEPGQWRLGGAEEQTAVRCSFEALSTSSRRSSPPQKTAHGGDDVAPGTSPAVAGQERRFGTTAGEAQAASRLLRLFGAGEAQVLRRSTSAAEGRRHFCGGLSGGLAGEVFDLSAGQQAGPPEIPCFFTLESVSFLGLDCLCVQSGDSGDGQLHFGRQLVAANSC